MTTLVVKKTEVDWSAARRHAIRLEKKRKSIVTAGGHALLDEANETVPKEEGDLEASGFVSVDDKGEVVVGYSAPYALRQHEVPMNHPGQGRWKWLEMTAKEGAAQDAVADAMADEIKEAI